MMKIMTVDDHPLFLHGYQLLLNDFPNISIIEEAQSAEEALEKVQQNPHVEIVLMDLNLRNMDGLEATKKLIAVRPQLKILLCAPSQSDLLGSYMLEAGGAGVWQKNSGQKSLVHALESLHEGATYFGEGFLESYKPDGNPTHPAYEPKPLEREFLHWLAREYPIHEIANRLNLTILRVKNLLNELCKRLLVPNSSRLLERALAYGWIEW